MDPHFDGMVFRTHPQELARRIQRTHPPLAVLDLRPAAAHAAGHVPGAVGVTADLAPDAVPVGVNEVVLVGHRGDDPEVRRALDGLQRAGVRRRVELAGGMAEWLRLGLPVERSGPSAS